MEKIRENIALFDMDGTLCDYEKSLNLGLEKLRSPDEKRYTGTVRDDAPDYIRARLDLIRSSEKWWAELPKLKLGWDVLKVAKKLGYKMMILTQGSRSNPNAWSGKMMWIRRYLQDIDMTITRDKSLIYGKILVDDYPGYIERWLSWRPRGLVIMPVNKHNKNYKHPQVIKYDGTNLGEVKKAMKRVMLHNE